MKGNKIQVTPDPKGRYEWGPIFSTPLPGTPMQIYASASPIMQGGRFWWQTAAPGTAGLSVLKAILLEDDQQGFGVGTAYVSGCMGRLYYPQRGEEMNLFAAIPSGTGFNSTVGESLMLAATGGGVIPYTGSPQETFAISLEAIRIDSGTDLLWCKMI